MLEPKVVFKMQVQLETVKGIHPEFIKAMYNRSSHGMKYLSILPREACY